MSYYLRLSFCDVKDELDAFKKALKTVEYFKSIEGQNEIIKTIIENENITCEDVDNIPLLEGFIYKHFRFKFVYFKKLNILAFNGECKKFFPVLIHFQDSGDQNYDYSVWKGISYFESVISKSKNISIEELKEFFIKYGYEEDDFEEVSDIEYFRKSFVYKTIFNSLNLNDYLYSREKENFHSDDFESFILSGIDSPYEVVLPKANLRKKLKENITEENENDEI